MTPPDGDAPPPGANSTGVPEPSEPSVFDAEGALTREFLLARGYCCENGCQNCPWGCVNRSR